MDRRDLCSHALRVIRADLKSPGHGPIVAEIEMRCDICGQYSIWVDHEAPASFKAANYRQLIEDAVDELIRN